MPKPIPLENLVIEKMDEQMRGLCFYQDTAIFVQGALIGERVEAKASKKTKKVVFAEAIKIHQASALRQTPPCPAANSLVQAFPCGGCSLQHLPAEYQITYKSDLVKRILHRSGFDNFVFAEPIKGPSFGYRSRARLSVRYDKTKARVRVGFREKFSHRVAATETCPILQAPFDSLLEPLAELVMRLQKPDSIPQIALTATKQKNLCIFRHMQELSEDERHILADFGVQHNLVIGLQAKSENQLEYLGGENGRCQYAIRGRNIEFYPYHFTQVNFAINAQILDFVACLVETIQPKIVFDCFGGIGNFAIAVDSVLDAPHIYLVESNEDAVAQAQHNFRVNAMHRAQAVVADLFTPQGLQSLLALPAPELLLLDPPRSGAECICRNIQALNPQHIIYISCDPQTLGRDAGHLHENGYSLVEARVADMFPQTSHIESIAYFCKNS